MSLGFNTRLKRYTDDFGEFRIRDRDIAGLVMHTRGYAATTTTITSGSINKIYSTGEKVQYDEATTNGAFPDENTEHLAIQNDATPPMRHGAATDSEQRGDTTRTTCGWDTE